MQQLVILHFFSIDTKGTGNVIKKNKKFESYLITVLLSSKPQKACKHGVDTEHVTIHLKMN